MPCCHTQSPAYGKRRVVGLGAGRPRISKKDVLSRHDRDKLPVISHSHLPIISFCLPRRDFQFAKYILALQSLYIEQRTVENESTENSGEQRSVLRTRCRAQRTPREQTETRDATALVLFLAQSIQILVRTSVLASNLTIANTNR